MSTHDQSSGEMDLGAIFDLIRKGFLSLVRECFEAVGFVLKRWWIILLLIGAGVALGLWNKPEPTYTASVIVKTNFGTQPIVYNTVSQISSNLYNSEFLRKNEVDTASFSVMDVQIKPAVNVLELMSKMENTNSRNFEVILRNLEVSDEVNVMASGQFLASYDYHTMEISLGRENAYDDVEKIIEIINNNELIQRLAVQEIKGMETKINRLDSTIAQIDFILDQYMEVVGMGNQQIDNLSFYNSQNNLNINGLITNKAEYFLEVEQLKVDLVTSQMAVVAVSNVEFAEVSSLRDRKELLYPVALVGIFLLLAFGRYLYFILKRQIDKELS
ncbi:hypothetical protein [Aureitalea marina]|uniref:Uncharacterized protein n=1 Tax=Aureitalea marina TaxID=930804 RepID=A0A2S7KS75_9FLAO|nr:hypothetical protein [Aureitalea marina]PQB05479.1 hypothetical protein BST85_11695 [Aureitalea marina]